MKSPLSDEKLSIIIPAYNEERRIKSTLKHILNWTQNNLEMYEVIVVNDASTDNTSNIVQSFDQDVQLITLKQNRGKGGSIARGVAAATGDYILFTDADLSTPIEDVKKLAAYLATHDIAIGSRACKESIITKHQPWHRKIMGKIFNKIVRLLAVRGIHDTQCGFKLFKAPVAKALFSNLTINGFAFDVEVLFLAQKRNYTIVEVPVSWKNDAQSRVHPLLDSLRMLRDLIRIRVTHREK